VNSFILKLLSNFFRKFLDSRDKAGGPSSALWQYEYVSVIDEDGMWALEPTAKVSHIKALVIKRSLWSTVPDDGQATATPGRKLGRKPVWCTEWQPEDETEMFRKLLCAMYNRPYRIESPDELIVITKLADYYCALPIVSSTIGGAC
jgi:hypothetical protein